MNESYLSWISHTSNNRVRIKFWVPCGAKICQPPSGLIVMPKKKEKWELKNKKKCLKYFHYFAKASNHSINLHRLSRAQNHIQQRSVTYLLRVPKAAIGSWRRFSTWINLVYTEKKTTKINQSMNKALSFFNFAAVSKPQCLTDFSRIRRQIFFFLVTQSKV